MFKRRKETKKNAGSVFADVILTVANLEDALMPQKDEAQFTFTINELPGIDVLLKELSGEKMDSCQCGGACHCASKEMQIKDVIFNNPVTVVFWEDGTKTIVRCQEGDTYSKEAGLAMAIVKRLYGNNSSYYDKISKWTGER